jgi:hypothetical protein
VTKRGRRALEGIVCIAALAAIVTLAQACGGGSASEDASPTATSPPVATSSPAAAAGDRTPPPGFTPEAGMPGGRGLFVGGASEELAAFLGISLEQLQSELDTEGATLASVADAHGRTREELKAFFTEQQEAQLSDAVAAGTMSQEDADQTLEDFASRIDDMIDGNMSFGGGPGDSGSMPGGGGLIIGGASEELAAFLGISLDQLETELSAEGATPASVAEAHGRTRDELTTFYTEQIEAQVLEAVVAGTISPDEGDAMIERLTSNIDAIIDRSMPSGGPGFAPTPSGQ